MKFRWPFSKKRNERWVGINLSSLNPSAVIYSNEGIVDAVTYDQEQGIDALALWLKQHVTHGTPAVLVLDDDDYELLLVEAPAVPDEELSAAIEFRIGDLLAQPIEETAIQALRLPREAYRGRMSMAHAIACPDETIKKRVRWAQKLHLVVEIITVPELSLLNVLAASSIDHGIALLELGPNHGCIRLYQNGALFLTRQVEMGIDALDINSAFEKVTVEDASVGDASVEDASVEEGDHDDLNLEEMRLDDLTSENSNSGDDFESSELQFEVVDDDWAGYKEAYVGFSQKAQVNGQQVENLVLEVQRSLDYYESQLGMGQITQLWLMGGDRDLKDLVDAMQPLLTAHIEQPDIADKLAQKVGMEVSDDVIDINKSVTALGGALAYAAR
ncbi:MAG: MSHA biogenesis protein MshI [Oleispira sp.]